MARLGFIHEKLDIKILILFILRRLPGEVEPETLCELCQCDGGIDYFDYSDCLSDLIETGHIKETPTGYTITLPLTSLKNCCRERVTILKYAAELSAGRWRTAPRTT